jgi:predicted kinase
VYINSDELRLKLLSKRTYSLAEKYLVYEHMLAALTDALRDNKTIILDATFYKENIRNIFEEKASSFNEQIIYIEVTAPENIIAKRINKPRTYSEADFDVYLKLKTEFEPMLKEHLVLATYNNEISPSIEKAISYINTVK